MDWQTNTPFETFENVFISSFRTRSGIQKTLKPLDSGARPDSKISLIIHRWTYHQVSLTAQDSDTVQDGSVRT